MAKQISFSKGIGSILFWSVISAAFIGPGTVTTAAKAGAQFGSELLWALTFSTIACLILQEAAARITIVAGKSLGQAIASRSKAGAIAVCIAAIFGCAAYQAGNLLGAVSGTSLVIPIHPKVLAVIIGVGAALLLWFGKTQLIARALGLVVFAMGGAIIFVAISNGGDPVTILGSAFTPTLPKASGILVVALIGTTIVPYNLFLGSGIGQGQTIREMRHGLSIAILLGGLISMAVVLVGTTIIGEFSFEALAEALSKQVGDWAKWLFAFGLFAAGFTSAVTAPLAAAITGSALLGNRWTEGSTSYKFIWLGVLTIGVLFCLIDVKPIPAIITAQAINGLLLPFITIYLLIAINDPKVMPLHKLNPWGMNVLVLLVMLVTVTLGAKNLYSASTKAIGAVDNSVELLQYFAVLALVVTAAITFVVIRLRKA